MKIIEVDEELYQYIASKTQSIGESASDILRRLLDLAPLSSGLSAQLPADDANNKQTDEGESATEGSSKTAKNKKQGNKDKDLLKQSMAQVKQPVVNNLKSLLTSPEFIDENKAVVRFLAILRLLYCANAEKFAQATESLQGRTRVYFAQDEATLLAAGNHTKPKQIPDTPYWVITNTNSGRKMLMLEAVMQAMHLPADLIEQVRSFFVAN